ncbi:MAG: exopolysaccharide biosynthesis polyprenyl glycosylphosphotransferase [Frankiales bacterium]|nr:exopolysaccharide biosynthesis polyprenyl glycosylphosphotransferase [Frankiales bacterium]
MTMDRAIEGELMRTAPVVPAARQPTSHLRRSAVGRRPRPGPPRFRRKWISRGVGPYLLSLDVVAIVGGTAVLGRFDDLHLAFAALMLALFAAAGAYRSRLSFYALEDGCRLIGRTVAAAAVVGSLGLVLRGSEGVVGLLRTSVVVAVAVFLLRSVGYAVVRASRARGLVTHRTLVLGAGRVGVQLVELLQHYPEYGLRPVGFLDSPPLLRADDLPAPLLGGPDQLAATILREGIEDVIVAFGGLPAHDLVEVLRTCDRLQCEIFFVPRLFELHATAQNTDAVRGMPLLRMRRAAYRTAAWKVKRLIDVIVSALALLVLSPLLLACAAAVRLESGRGVLFRQVRVGLDGRPFELLKLRSLRPADDDESATRWNVAHDDRLGPVGRFLRQTSLDELPQLWNILRGDMSLIGPRPERPHFVDTFASTLPRYVARHRVPAGLTGWAQVHGLRGDTSIAERARFDNYYIENWSLGMDVRIALMTVVSVLRRRGA